MRLDRDPEIHVGPRARYAARKGSATSRDRAVGRRWQPRGQGRRGLRTVRYSEIDRGRRSEWNAGIIARNQARAYARAEHRERQAVRLRQMELRALRRAWALERQRAGRSPSQRAALERARVLALRRAQRARTLLATIEMLMASLFQAHGQHRQRQRSLLRPGFIPVPFRGRGRQMIMLPPP